MIYILSLFIRVCYADPYHTPLSGFAAHMPHLVISTAGRNLERSDSLRFPSEGDYNSSLPLLEVTVRTALLFVSW